MNKDYFFCGVGGSGMLPLAMIVQAQGNRIAGSDRALDQGRTPDKFDWLRARGVTVMATWEMRDLFGTEISAPTHEMSSLVDNLMLMRFVEINSELKRSMSILKMRDSAYNPALLEIVFGERGIRLEQGFRHASAVLTGTATAATDK